MTQVSLRRRLALAGAMVAIAAITPALLAVQATAGPHSKAKSHSGSALTLDWFDLTRNAVNATNVPGGSTEQSTQGRTWAVSWLAAARAVADGHGSTFRQGAFVPALHDALVPQVQPFAPSQVALLDDARTSSLGDIPDGA